MPGKPINETAIDLHGWRDRVASDDGPPSTTRLVLLVLSLHMNRTGWCHPKVATVARRSSLSERIVSEHLREAARAGWIEIGRRPGKLYRQRTYQACWPTSPDPPSGEAGSHDPPLPDLPAPLTLPSRGTHLRVNHPLNHPTRNGELGQDQDGDLPVPEQRTHSLATAADPPDGPAIGSTQDRAPGPPPGLSLTDLVNGLRKVYPHPTNRGGPRTVPNPVAIEQWLAERIRLGKLEPQDYPAVLAGAERAAVAGRGTPDRFRRKLRTWIREHGWTDQVEEQDDGPVLPPPSTGPKFTPEGW